MLSFMTRTINPAKAPFRIRFRLSSALSTSGNVKITLPANQYGYTGTSLLCYFKTYTSELDYTTQISATGASTPTITGTLGTGYTMTVSPRSTLAANRIHELVCDTDDLTGFNRLAIDNQMLTATFTDGTALAITSLPLYRYQANPALRMNSLHIGTQYSTNPNTIILSLTANSLISTFPNQAVEIEFTSASNALIKSGFNSLSRDIQCGIVPTVSNVNLRSLSKGTLRCTLVQSSPPKVRIENYNQINSGTTFTLMLYDLDNSKIAQSFIGYLDIKVLVTNPATGTQFQHRARRLFTPLASGVTIPTTALDFPTSSILTYSTATTLTSSITWAAGDTCSLGSCRLIIKGKNTDWKFRRTSFDFTVNGASQSELVDEVNNIFGKYFYLNILFY